MEVMEAIYTRRAVREYTDQAVDRATVQSLIDAAVQAPSAVNQQPWAFAVIQDRALLARYSKQAKALFLNSSQAAALHPPLRDLVAAPGFNIFYNAGTLIVVCARPGTARGARDCCLAAENLMLAARSLGLGTCPIGFAWELLERPEVKRELDIPEDHEPVLPIIVGYPVQEPQPVVRERPQILCWR